MTLPDSHISSWSEKWGGSPADWGDVGNGLSAGSSRYIFSQVCSPLLLFAHFALEPGYSLCWDLQKKKEGREGGLELAQLPRPAGFHTAEQEFWAGAHKGEL